MGWTEKEVRAAVDAYFRLLAIQQDGGTTNKAEIYRELGRKYSRSPKSFERKFQNISAILFEQHLPYCDGLKPFHNYQRLLKLVVLDHLDRCPIPAVESHEILFSKLGGLGHIKVVGNGSGRYGLALEHALGIKANSSKIADFMGIELKTKHGKTLQTLFSRVPTRYLQGGDRAVFFDKHSSYDAKRSRRALYTSFSNKPDTLGFALNVKGLRVEVTRSGASVLEYDAERIEEVLLSKHSQTAFISVLPTKKDGKETITIDSVRYCKWPSILRFLSLVDAGEIFLDFTLSEKGGKLKDHGFLWRIRSESIDRLYLHSEAVQCAA